MQRGTQSDLFLKSSFCLLLEKEWEGTKVKAGTMVQNAGAVQQETVGSWIRWWWRREGAGGMSGL